MLRVEHAATVFTCCICLNSCGSKFIAKVFETADISKQVCHSMSPLRLQDKG